MTSDARYEPPSTTCAIDSISLSSSCSKDRGPGLYLLRRLLRKGIDGSPRRRPRAVRMKRALVYEFLRTGQ